MLLIACLKSDIENERESDATLCPTALNTSIPNNTTTLHTSPPNNDTSSSEEVRRLRFENLILQSKVETLEAENKSLKEVRVIM